MKVDFSSLFNLNLADLIKGLLMAVIGAVISAVYTGVESGGVEWNVVWKVAVTTGLGYLIKNFFSPPPTTVVVDRSKTDIEFKK